MRSIRTHATESEILRSILGYLRNHPSVAMVARFNSGAIVREDKGKKRLIRFGFKGCSDILGFMKDGKILAIEVKKHDGILTDHQEEFLKMVHKAGGHAGVARSIEDSEKIVSERKAVGLFC